MMNAGEVSDDRLDLQVISRHLQIGRGCEVMGVFLQPI
jgi:hypothetical protein